jgi:hypothetical protein
MAAPRLCPIYLREVLGFFRRSIVEECREVSDHFDTTILCCPEGRKPRQKITLLFFNQVDPTVVLVWGDFRENYICNFSISAMCPTRDPLQYTLYVTTATCRAWLGPRTVKE